MVCLAHCRQELQQKSWKTARLFLQDRDQDQDQDFMIQDQDQDFHFLSSRRLETKTLVSRTTSLVVSTQRDGCSGLLSVRFLVQQPVKNCLDRFVISDEHVTL